jgi:hypothetical protein
MNFNRLIAWLLIAIFGLTAGVHLLIARERVAAEEAQAEAARLYYDAIAGTVRARVILMNAEAEWLKLAARERRR